MLSRRVADPMFAGMVLMADLYFIGKTMEIPNDPGLDATQMSSRFFPIVVLIFIGGCAAIILLKGIKDFQAKGPTVDLYSNGREAFNALMTFAVAVACFILWVNAGFLSVAILLGPATALVVGERSVKKGAILVIMGLAVYTVFTRLLGVQLS